MNEEALHLDRELIVMIIARLLKGIISDYLSDEETRNTGEDDMRYTLFLLDIIVSWLWRGYVNRIVILIHSTRELTRWAPIYPLSYMHGPFIFKPIKSFDASKLFTS